MKTLKTILLFATMLAAAVAVPAQANADWIRDYEAIKQYMSEAYANFEWARTKVDLADLDRRTSEGLRQAKTEQDAQKVLMAFFATFRDGHLRLQRPQPPRTGPQAAVTKDTPAGEACRTLGYAARPQRFSVPFDKLPDFKRTSAEGDPFLAGVFRAGGRTVGVISIPLFAAEAYPANCASVWDEFRSTIDGDCDAVCAWRLRATVEERLTGLLAGHVRALAAEKADALLIDIGENGGGSEWAETVAAVVSRAPVRRPPVRFIRHPHWVGILRSQLADVDYDLARKDISKEQRKMLKGARKRIAGYLAEAAKPCDLSPFWSGDAAKVNCSRLVAEPLGDGFAENAEPRLLEGLRSRRSLRRLAPYDFEKGIFAGKVFVLVDRRTASASEMFASMLQAARSATVVGGRTAGAGCGYVDGGTEYFLPVSKLRLRMPDCARFRTDGVNEVEGIVPDAPIFADGDTPETKLKKLTDFLSN